MLVRSLAKSLWERKASGALVLLSVTSAAALLSAFLSLAFHLTEEMAKEFRAFGANILLVPKSEPLEIGIGGLRYVTAEESAYLEEADLPALKTVFWRHNIIAFAPFLSRVVEVGGRRALVVGAWLDREFSVPEPDGALPLSGETRAAVGPAGGRFRTGLKSLSPWWRVEGRWPGERDGGLLVGASLARELTLAVGSALTLAYESRSLRLSVVGIVQTGGVDDERIFVDLEQAQALFGLSGKVEAVEISALVTPDNALALRAARVGPAALPPEEYETWYCTPYLGSIIHQLEEAIPDAKGKAIRRVSQGEGAFLAKLKHTFGLVVAVALLAGSLGVMATMVTAIFERRREIGLMKALGADRRQVGLFFLLEAAAWGLAGGALGYFGGLALARELAARAFSTSSFDLSFASQGIILATTLIMAVGMALLGSFLPVRQAMRLEPMRALRGIW
jgi:putative ABC transport system permease protein